VPLTTGGKLKIVASADLGGLGAKDGAPVEYDWALPGFAPLLLPWLMILGLLALKPNRRAAAWLIWLPVGCVSVLTLLPPDMPGGANFFLDAIAALAFGLAAVWLLPTYLRQSHRVVTFFCVLFALAFFSGLAFVFRQGWSLLNSNTLESGVVLGVGMFASTVALSLGGWICRARFRPAGFYVWLLVSLAAIWLMLAAPFFIIAEISDGGRIPLSEFFLPVLAVAAGNFLLLLPFLILSSASSFYRDRLKLLLNLKPVAPPLLNAPAVAESNLKT
jgi:hypothetical protein